jgi:hypothetical protein
MGTLPETNNFDTTVYQLEITDAVLGGAGQVANAPAQNLTNRSRWLYNQVQSILSGLAAYAALASPLFTGTPKAPTPSAGDNSTSLATTAYTQTATQGIEVVNVAGGANVSLSGLQAGYGILVFQGALTANIAVIFPGSGKWLLVNETSGAFTLTAKLATGSGLVIGQNKNRSAWSDGFNFFAAENEATTAGAADSSTAQATTAWVQEQNYSSSGVSRGVQSYATAGTFSFTVPAAAIEVEVWGAGGSGASSPNTSGSFGGSGAGGGYAKKLITGLTVGSTINIVVGAGQPGGAANANAVGTTGGSSSVGSYVSASGGAGGNIVSTAVAGGSGFGGDENISGQSSSGNAAPYFADAQFGGSAPKGGFGAVTGSAATAPGGGGGGAGPGYAGGTSAPGRVVIRW